MFGEYEPTLLEVAKLLYATSGEGPADEVLSLMDWLVEQIPEVRELWETLNEPLGGSVTFRDLVDLHLCLHEEHRSARVYGVAVWLLRQVPATACLWSELEQMSRDAGCLLQYPSHAVDVVIYHDQVDRLLATENWATAEEALDVTGEVGASYNPWLGIVEARLARGEGDAERLREVRDRLRAEAAIARNRPVLEDHLPKLKQVLLSQEGREKLAGALEDLVAALRPSASEPAALAHEKRPDA